MTSRLLVLAVSATLVSAGCHSMHRGEARATASMHDGSGRAVGVLELEQRTDGVRVVGELTGLPPGTHGIHFHQVGRCDGPDFVTAGPHFNPANRHHGLENPAGPHAGDLPNLIIPASGTVRIEILSPRVTLDDARTGLFDNDGTALVIHANVDDQHTDPAGNSGPRIVCGAITRR